MIEIYSFFTLSLQHSVCILCSPCIFICTVAGLSMPLVTWGNSPRGAVLGFHAVPETSSGAAFWGTETSASRHSSTDHAFCFSGCWEQVCGECSLPADASSSPTKDGSY